MSWSIPSLLGSLANPLNTRVAHRACNSAAGKNAPEDWIRPTTASVDFGWWGGNTCLYSDTALSFTGRMYSSLRNSKLISYPVHEITASKLFTLVPSENTTPILVKYEMWGFSSMVPVAMRSGRSSLMTEGALRNPCFGRSPYVAWSKRFSAFRRWSNPFSLGGRFWKNLVSTRWSHGNPCFSRREITQAPRCVLR